METRHHAGHDIDGKRDPGPSHGLAGHLINDDDINLRVVDLHDLQRPCDLVLPGSCNASAKQALLPSAGGANSLVNEEQPGLDSSPSRHGKTLLPARRSDVPCDRAQRRPSRLQIFTLQEFFYQCVSSRLLTQASLRPPKRKRK
jgi:hypothetical protein